jgi:hypothetical protein
MEDTYPRAALHRRMFHFGRPLPPATLSDLPPDWEQADPTWIRKALHHARARPSGGWYVVDSARTVTERPRCVQVATRSLVVFRVGERMIVAPNACPHMGADLSSGSVQHGRLVCPWHGLALGVEGHQGWKPLPSYYDGVLLWVRLDEPGEKPTPSPYLTQRPSTFIDSVVRLEARCDPRDVIANRLDPWHGVHFHPHAFARLQIVDQSEEDITVRVAYRVFRRLVIEVDARFHCPDPRTIAMTIVRGDGEGSVVETHATPMGPGRTAIIEATLATSDRRGFALARRAAALFRPLIERRALKLWREDATYAERLHVLRRGSSLPEQGNVVPLYPRTAR